MAVAVSTWNYRILRYPEGDYGLHEVYYTDDVPDSWTVGPKSFHGDEPEDIIKALELALADAKKRPVLQISEDEENLLPIGEPPDAQDSSSGAT